MNRDPVRMVIVRFKLIVGGALDAETVSVPGGTCLTTTTTTTTQIRKFDVFDVESNFNFAEDTFIWKLIFAPFACDWIESSAREMRTLWIGCIVSGLHVDRMEFFLLDIDLASEMNWITSSCEGRMTAHQRSFCNVKNSAQNYINCAIEKMYKNDLGFFEYNFIAYYTAWTKNENHGSRPKTIRETNEGMANA